MQHPSHGGGLRKNTRQTKDMNPLHPSVVNGLSIALKCLHPRALFGVHVSIRKTEIIRYIGRWIWQMENNPRTEMTLSLLQ